MSLFVTLSASSTVLPLINSVSAELEAMALAQPKVWNLASTMRCSLSTLRKSLSASPQAMLPTSPTPSASGISPTLRGLRKNSLTLSV
jgi:hypothetical protein